MNTMNNNSSPKSDDISQIKMRAIRGGSSDMPSYLQSKFTAAPQQQQNLNSNSNNIVANSANEQTLTIPLSKLNIDQSQSQLPHAHGKRIVPSKLGNSHETPTYLRTKHGIISPDTYNNPFINNGGVSKGTPINNENFSQLTSTPSSASQLKNHQTFSIFNRVTDNNSLSKEIFHIKEVATKPAYNMLTHEKQSSSKVLLRINERPKFNDDYKKLAEATQNPFHRKTNYFSDFVQRNDVMNVFGGLNARERPPKFIIVKDFSLPEEKRLLLQEVRKNSQPTRISRKSSLASTLSQKDLLSNSRTFLPPESNSTRNLNLNNSSALAFSSSSSATPLKMNLKQIRLPSQVEDGQSIVDLPQISPPTNRSSTTTVMRSTLTNLNLDNPASSNLLLNTQPNNNYSIANITKSDSQLLPHSRLSKNSILSNLKDCSATTVLRSNNNNDRSSLHIQPKIFPTKFDKVESEENQKELRSIEAFEDYLKSVKGNNYAGSKMGSIYFKGSNRS